MYNFVLGPFDLLNGDYNSGDIHIKLKCYNIFISFIKSAKSGYDLSHQIQTRKLRDTIYVKRCSFLNF